MAAAFNLRHILVRNMSAQVFSQAVSVLLGLISVGILSRYLGVDAFGQFNYIFAFYYFFMVLSDLGIDVIAVREISNQSSDAASVLGSLRTFKLIVSLFLALAAVMLIHWMNFPEPLNSSLKIYAGILPVLALQTTALIFQTSLKIQYGALIGMLNRLFNFTLMIVLVSRGFQLRALTIALVISEIFSLFLITFFTRNTVRPIWILDWMLCRKVLSSSLPIALTGIFVAILNRIDFLMLERMSDIHQVGLYAASYKITNLIETLPGMMMTTLFPVMSRYASENSAMLKNVYTKSSLILGCAGAAAGVAITVMAPYLLEIIFGSSFRQAASGLRLLIWATAALYFALPAGHLLISLGKEKINLGLTAFAAILNVGLNLIFIPRYSYTGAALATMLCYIVLMVLIRSSAAYYLKQRRPSENSF